MKRFFLLILLSVPLLLQAQYTLKGIVRDSVNGQLLPFVTIIMNDNVQQGTTTDSTGHFEIQSKQAIQSLTFSYVGYDTKRIPLSLAPGKEEFYVKLSPLENQLQDVEVFAGENPANRIIKLAVQNREANNYANLNSYSYDAYEKFVITAIPPGDTVGKKEDMKKLYQHLEQNHLLIMEAKVQRKYLAPDLTKETVVAQKVSGLQNPNFTVLISEFQTTNFYKPFIDIADVDYANPINANSWNEYFFNIEDTLYEGSDTVFVLSYVPAKGKHFQSLKGTIEINTGGYAIEHVTAQPADTSVETLFAQIEQRYKKVDSTHWFPTQLNINIGFKKFFVQGMSVYMSGKTYISNAQVNPALTKKDFDGVAIDMLNDAADKNELYWQQERSDTLTLKEQRTYNVLDSLGKKNHLDNKLQWANSLQDGNLKFKYVSIKIDRILKFNKPETVRVGLGLETNSDISKKIIVGGFAGYGIHDALWKYGGTAEWRIYRPKNVSVTASYSQDYEENGGQTFFQDDYLGSGENTRNYTITNFDFVTREEAAFTARLRKYVNVQLKAFNTHKEVTNGYEFLTEENGEPVLLNHFSFGAVQAAVRFSYKERIIESLDHYYWINEGFPTIWLQVTQGVKGFLNSDFTYTKYEGKFEFDFPTKSLGRTYITLAGGFVKGDIPSTDLYSGRSSYSLFGLYAWNSFQTMRSNEFLSDRFASFYFTQDFEKNIIRWGKFQPNVLLVTNVGWGTLTNAASHVNETFGTMDKGYFESGIILNDLIAKKFFGVARIGVGAGAFYRYGPYAFHDPLQNLAIKATWSYTFN